MKTEINRIQKVLLLVIGVLTVILAVVLIYKGYHLVQDKKQEQEWATRHDEVQAELDDVRLQIQELSSDTDALQAFLEEYVDHEVIVLEESEKGGEDAEGSQDAIVIQEQVDGQESLQSTEQTAQGEKPQQGESTVKEPSESDIQAVISGAIVIEPPQPEESEEQSSEPGEEDGEESEQADGESEEVGEESEQADQDLEQAAENEQAGEQSTEYQGDAIIIEEPVDVTEQEQTDLQPELQSEAEESQEQTDLQPEAEEQPQQTDLQSETEEQPQQATISGNAIVNGEVIPFVPVERVMTLEEKRSVRSSYEETLLVNQEDKEFLNGSTYDFSGMKIACLGDSLTEGSNMDDLENYQQYAYPSVLKNILQAEEITNLGIGGSSYGRYWDKAFVDRYKEIPEDTDIILVMGGTNDGFAASEKELGSLEEKAPRTFYGDVDELVRGLKADYPEAKIIFITPLPNVLHDYLRSQRDYLLPQSVFADAVKELAAQHQIDVIDLYNSNILDTHDAQIIANYMPDGVHCNPAGYEILAQHIACGVIRSMEKDKMQAATVSGNTLPATVSGNGDGGLVSGNGLEISVSGNETDGIPFIDSIPGSDAIVIDATGEVKMKKFYEE